MCHSSHIAVVGASLSSFAHSILLLVLSGRREGGVAMAAMMEESLHPPFHRNNHCFLQLAVLPVNRQAPVITDYEKIVVLRGNNAA